MSLATLGSALNRLYSEFSAANRRPGSIEFCECCISADEINVLCTQLVRELSERDLERYSWSAPIAIGTAKDFLYFLPRLLELSLDGVSSLYFLEGLMERFREQAAARITPEQRAALDDFFRQAILNCCRKPDRAYLIADWFTASAIAGYDVSKSFANVEAYPDALSCYHSACTGDYPDRVLWPITDVFWPHAEEQRKKVVRWLASKRIREVLADH